MINKSVIIHPFLFAIYPILSLYASNSDRAPFYVILIPGLLALILAFTLFFVSKFIGRDSAKAGVVATLVLIFFFSYGHIFHSILIQLHIGSVHIGRERYMLPAYILFSVLTVYIALFIIKRRQILAQISQSFNVMAFVLVVLCVANIVNAKSKSWDMGKESISNNNLSVHATKNLPDVYYIVLDMYASSDTLRYIYGYDNSGFSRFLESRGFYVAYKSRSNYPITDLSLASTLNMKYLDDLREIVGKNKKDRTPLLQIIKNNKISQMFKSHGYRYIQFCSGYGVTEANPYADINYCSCGFFTEYLKVLMDTTVLSSLYGNYVEPNIIRKRVRYIFDELPKVPYVKGPKFTFVHVPVPHYPYVFGRNGEKLSPFVMTNDKGRYLDQLVYVNKMIPNVVDRLLAKSKIPPIIIIQGDHGPDTTGTLVSPTDIFIKERFNILNAYYLPGKDRNKFLYKSISPVNSFRLISNLYFGANYALLPDVSFLFKYEDLYNFTPIGSGRLEY